MASEITQHSQYSFSADIRSLGCVLYEMKTKLKPFEEEYYPFSTAPSTMIHFKFKQIAQMS
jgi:serine/threonine protein kinase